jgi:hypothetical protein
MSCTWARVLLVGLASSACYGQVSAGTQTQNPDMKPPTIQTAVSPFPPRVVIQPPALPPPSPPDMPLPDLSTLGGPSDNAKPWVLRKRDQLTPRCLDWIFHTCWSSPPGIEYELGSEADRMFAKNLEVAEFYFDDKNYRGAESRFREALLSKPNHPAATFKLAETLDKLGKANEARDTYKAYLKLQPSGSSAERARKALQRLEGTRRP